MTVMDKVLKALVLAAGKGARLEPLTRQIPKHLIPVANRPILYRVLDSITMAGIHQIGIVASPGNKKAIVRAIGDGRAWSAAVSYIIQKEPRGLADAVAAARHWLGKSGFLLFLGDNIFTGGIDGLIRDFESSNARALLCLKEVAEPRHFGVAVVQPDGRVLRVAEKPARPESNLAITGLYLFRPIIHDIIAGLKPSARGELEITDAISTLIHSGHPVHSRFIDGWWYDTGTNRTILEANRTLLGEQPESVHSETIVRQSSILRPASIGRSSLLGCRIIGPVLIGDGCSIHNSTIGPHCSIGHNAVIENSSLIDCIVAEQAVLNNARLESSIVGPGACIRDDGTRRAGLILANQAQQTT